LDDEIDQFRDHRPLAPTPDLSRDEEVSVVGGRVEPAALAVVRLDSGLVIVAGGALSRSLDRDLVLRSAACVAGFV